MQVMLLLVAVGVGAADPILWIAPVISAFFSRGRWWIVPLTGLIWAAVLELALSQMLPDGGGFMGYRIASGLLVGLVVLGIATVIRKMRAAPPAVAAEEKPAARE